VNCKKACKSEIFSMSKWLVGYQAPRGHDRDLEKKTKLAALLMYVQSRIDPMWRKEGHEGAKWNPHTTHESTVRTQAI